jgi:mRNA interferase RelE/StbE
MAWKVELSATAHRELNKIDAQQARRILKFLHECVSKPDNPSSIRKALQGSL